MTEAQLLLGLFVSLMDKLEAAETAAETSDNAEEFVALYEQLSELRARAADWLERLEAAPC